MNLRPTWTIGTLVRAHLAMFGAGLLVLGISQLAQPYRWEAARSYGQLYTVLTPTEWGAILLVIAVLKLLATLRFPRFALLAIVAGSALFAFWTVSFAIAYFSDRQAPPATAVMVAWLLAAHLGIATVLAPRRLRRDAFPPGEGSNSAQRQ
jgi:hypothetical protein